jgi:hypothetical protein
VVGYRLVTRLSGNPLVRVLFVAMLTNTLMFTFIGASVSYDNLVNLLATLALFSFVVFVQDEQPRDLLLFLLWILLGGLTKFTFLPVVLILVLALLVERRRRVVADVSSLLRPEVLRGPRNAILCVLVLFAVVANLWLYGGNKVRYGRVVPSCSQVLELEQCMENRIFARNWVVNRYRSGQTTYQQALQETSGIGHKGDREHAVRLLQNERAFKQANPKLLPAWDYMQVVWVQAMKPTIFGIQAHLSILRDPWGLLPYSLILFVGSLLVVRGLRWADGERVWVYMALLVVGYYVALVGWFNYKNYLQEHALFLGVQGRYIFPVIVPAYLLLARFLLLPFRRSIQIALVIIVAAIFVMGDFPYFNRNVGEGWFAQLGPNGVEGVSDPGAPVAERPAASH